jgi:1-acyl-sn-glycerol-3-phosphate acyltransferase
MPDWLQHLWYKMSYWPAKVALTCAFSMRCEGGDHVPRKGPVLLIANHQSYLDPPLVGVSTRRHLSYLARKTLFTHPLGGAYLRSLGAVPVDQEGVAKEGLRIILDQLAAGKAILVFPEGERSATGELLPLKPGIHLLIRKSAAPIVPVGIAGAYEALPRSQVIPQLSPLILPATPGAVAVSIGRPISSERYREMPREKVLCELFEAILRMKQRAEHLRRKP